MVAVEGWAQLSSLKFILTGDMGDCPSLEPSAMGMGGSAFPVSRRLRCGDAWVVATGFLWIGLEGPEPALGEVSTAAIVKSPKCLTPGAPTSDEFPELQLSQLASQQVRRASEGVVLAQCYCDNCWRLCPDRIEMSRGRFWVVKWL